MEPAEVEFLAENTTVSIVTNFSENRLTLLTVRQHNYFYIFECIFLVHNMDEQGFVAVWWNVHGCSVSFTPVTASYARRTKAGLLACYWCRVECSIPLRMVWGIVWGWPLSMFG